MKRKTLFLVSLAVLLGVSSCGDDLSDTEEPVEVSVSLQAGDGVPSVENAEITLRCLNGRKPVAVPMAKSSDGQYAASLPAHYGTDTPFVEVVLDGQTYGYSPTDINFKNRRQYVYSLEVDTTGLTPVQTGSEIQDWGNGGCWSGEATM